MKPDIKTLKGKIKNFEFHPEVYVYPTPRTYAPINNFKLTERKFTNEINLYVHVPFCKKICSYCGYVKIIDSNEKFKEDYVNALAKEIELYKDILKDKIVKTLHFGGGTPSLLSIIQIKRILNKIIEYNPGLLKTCQEISIESTPELVEKNKFKQYKELGFNRVSIGIQTLNNSEIELSRRTNLAETSIKAIKILKNIGISNIVTDLMIGIEGQTTDSFKQSVKQLITYKPDTIELYALGLMPQTLLAKNNFKRMSNREIYKCYEIGRRLFLKTGYIQDCHNRYAIQNKGSFLQEDYIWKGMSLIGFGAGARTYAKDMHYRNKYYQNNHLKTITEYIKTMSCERLAAETGIILDKDEQIRQYLIGHLESLNKNDFKQNFGISFENSFPELLKLLLNLELAKENKNYFKLTKKGLLFRDLICTEFFSQKTRKVEELYRPRLMSNFKQ